MFTYINSSFSQISKNFISANIFSGISKDNNKIAIVALAIFSTIATLLIICRCFKVCKLNSSNSVVHPHITPSKPKPNSPPIDKTPKPNSGEKKENFVQNPTNPARIPPNPQLKSSAAAPKIVPDVSPTFTLNMNKFNAINKTEEVSFQKLSKQQASNVLDIDPTLRTRPAAQGKMFAYDAILIIHEQGVPDRLNTFSNNELMKQTQFIVYTISKETNLKKQKELLLELAICMEDCLPVTQGRITLMYMRLASVGKGLDKQVEHFLSGYKDRIVDQIINQLFPDMQKPGYAKMYHHQPSKQFPHMKTGFLAAVGKELGLNIIGAAEDPNKNTTDVVSKQNEFKKLFKELVSMQEIIKEFIIDVNGRNGQIDLDDLGRWCTPEKLGETEAYNIFYDVEFQYPSYSPEYDSKKNGEAPYLTEKSAYLIFESLGYVKRT